MCNPLVFLSALVRAVYFDLTSNMATKAEMQKLKER
jgi:hypothetical protein